MSLRGFIHARDQGDQSGEDDGRSHEWLTRGGGNRLCGNARCFRPPPQTSPRWGVFFDPPHALRSLCACREKVSSTIAYYGLRRAWWVEASNVIERRNSWGTSPAALGCTRASVRGGPGCGTAPHLPWTWRWL